MAKTMDYKERFKELYHKMRESRDVANMRTFGHASKKIFCRLADAHPEMAEEWLEMLTPIVYYNYISPEESGEILSHLVSQNGNEGEYWDKNTFEQAVHRLGGKMEDKPYYNDIALWVVANMIYSDHANSIAEDMGFASANIVPADRMAKSCYKKAVEKLHDPDRPRFVREYFDLD